MRKCKPKKCRVCPSEFQPMNSLQITCGLKCALELVEQKKEKVKKRDIRQADKINRQDIRARKLKLKNRADWIKDLQAIFNKFIRLRDKGENCISCGKSEQELKIKNPISMVCGHYLSVGAHPELRFTEFNAHLQCTRCNGGAGKYGQFNGKGLTVTKEYRVNLIKKIGQKNVDVLEGPHEPLKLDIDQIKAKITEYKIKIKEIE